MTKKIDEQERVRVWFHPLRRKLVRLLEDRGPMTQTELAKAVDTAPASARYHLLRLVRAGFVEPAGTRPGPKGITEKLFQHVELKKEPDMNELKLATKHGSAKDFEMRKMHLDMSAEAHRVGERIIMRDPETFFSIQLLDVKAPADKLRALRDALKQTLVGFMAGLDKPAEDDESVTVAINMYPRHVEG